MTDSHDPDDYDELAREIGTHLELEAEDRMAEGLAEEEARYAARRAFGSVARTQEDVRALWTSRWLDEAVQDMRLACRTIRRTPVVAVVAVLTLALGIGTTTAVFSVADAVLLRPLPEVGHPEELVIIQPDAASAVAAFFGAERPFLEALRARDEVIVEAFVWERPEDLWMHLPGHAPETGTPVSVQRVSGSFFETLGVDLVRGQGFDEQDARADGSAMAVISRDLWRREFGMAEDIIGRSIVVDEQPLTIAGVAPRAFRGPDVSVRPDLWQVWTDFHPGRRVMARLRPGAGVDEARAVAELVSAQLAGERGAARAPRPPAVSPGATGVHDARTLLTRPLAMLGAAAMLVLLIACANVAGLLLVSGQTRRQELVVRLALGGGRSRLIRQLLTGHSVLAVTGSVLGVLIALWSTRLLAGSRLLSAQVPVLALDAGIDLRVLLFSLGCGLLSVAIVGLVPAITLTRLEPAALAGHPPPGERAIWRPLHRARLLVTAQVSLALVLLVGAGLLLGTLIHLHRVEPGFRTDHTIYLRVERAPWARARPIDSPAIAALADRLETTPGIESVATFMGAGMLAGAEGSDSLAVPVAPGPPGGDLTVPVAGEIRCFYLYAGPGFFRTMGIPLVSGREFRAGERTDFVSPDSSSTSVIISQSLADRFFPQQDAVGKAIYTQRAPDARDVVGVVDDAQHTSLREGARCAVYFPVLDLGQFVVAVAGDPTVAKTTIAQTVSAFDASLEPRDLRTFGEVIDDVLVRERLVSRLSLGFAAIALIMVAIGIYGTVAYSVSQRTREIGIRMALGARPRTIAAMCARDTALTVGAGIAIGGAAAVVTSRALESLLFGVTPADPVTFVLAVLTLLATAGLACWLPARRATQVDAAELLRAE